MILEKSFKKRNLKTNRHAKCPSIKKLFTKTSSTPLPRPSHEATIIFNILPQNDIYVSLFVSLSITNICPPFFPPHRGKSTQKVLNKFKKIFTKTNIKCNKRKNKKRKLRFFLTDFQLGKKCEGKAEQFLPKCQSVKIRNGLTLYNNKYTASV